MDCASETLALLDDLQALDFTLLNLRRTFENLPQRQEILKARQTMTDLRERKESADDLVAKAKAKVDAVVDEDKRLEEKEAAVNALLNDKATGYRDVEARTKELAGIAKRRETLSHNLKGLQADLDKVSAVAEKINAALNAVVANEARLVASFKEEGTALMQEISATEARRKEFVPGIDAEMLALYEKTATKCGGVGLAHLQGKTCSVCRSTIDEARLNQLKHEAPLSYCPLCRRLLVVE